MSARILVDPITGAEYLVEWPEVASNGGIVGGLIGISLLSLFGIGMVLKLAVYEPLAKTVRLAADGYKEMQAGHWGAAAKKLILPVFVVLVFASTYAVMATVLLLLAVLGLVVVV